MKFFKMAYSMLAGLVIALAIFFLAVSLLPPDNMGYVDCQFVSVFRRSIVNVGLRLDGL